MIKKRFFPYIIVIEMVVFLAVYIYGSHGISELSVVKKINAQLEELIKDTCYEIVTLKKNKEEILGSIFYKEKIAREQLQLAHNDDFIYYLD